jgi:shikimate dehydrogenase
MKQYGILAHPAKHSLSPVMHNAAFNSLGIEAQYGTFDVAENELAKFMDQVKHSPINGVSVSLPHKEVVMEYLNEIDEDARKIGAVNTVHNRGGNLYGYNTDYLGCNRALLEVFDDLKRKKIVVLGAGGAARAVAYGVMKEGANVIIANRTRAKADRVAIEFAEMFESDIHSADLDDMVGGDILIHATSIWTKGEEPDVNMPDFCFPDYLENFKLVMDITYPPLNTPLILSCKDMGLPHLTAEKMLLYQAAAQFELWTGEKAPIEVMASALRKALVE